MCVCVCGGGYLEGHLGNGRGAAREHDDVHARLRNGLLQLGALPARCTRCHTTHIIRHAQHITHGGMALEEVVEVAVVVVVVEVAVEAAVLLLLVWCCCHVCVVVDAPREHARRRATGKHDRCAAATQQHLTCASEAMRVRGASHRFTLSPCPAAGPVA